MGTSLPSLADQVLNRVSARTGRRVTGLTVAVDAGRVVLRGRARSFHVKQLALHAALELVPAGGVENAVEVDRPVAVA